MSTRRVSYVIVVDLLWFEVESTVHIGFFSQSDQDGWPTAFVAGSEVGL
jgi:hypothetical protein